MKGTDQSIYTGRWKVRNRSSGPWHCSLLPGLCTDGHLMKAIPLPKWGSYPLSLSLSQLQLIVSVCLFIHYFFFSLFKNTGYPFHLFQVLFFLFFWPHCVAHGILVTQPGIKPVPSAVEVGSLHHWISREVPSLSISTNTVPQEGRKTWASSLLFSEQVQSHAYKTRRTVSLAMRRIWNATCKVRSLQCIPTQSPLDTCLKHSHSVGNWRKTLIIWHVRS